MSNEDHSIAPGASRNNLGHFAALDFYRFIAASGVVFLHFSEFSKHPGQHWLEVSTHEFYLFVDFFFILSGFVIAHGYSDTVYSARDTLTYLRRRIARIYPLYFLTLVFFLGSSSSGLSHYPDRNNAASILSQLTMMSSWFLDPRLPFNFPAWSISVEWAMYLVFPLILFVARRGGFPILLLVIAVGFFVNEKYISSGFLSAPLWFLDINPIRALPSFVTGILIAAAAKRFGSPHGGWMGLCAFLTSVAMMIVQANVYLVWSMFAASIFFTARTEHLGESRLFNNSICKALGDASYSVYMLHIIVIMVAVDFLWKRLTGNIEFPIAAFGVVVFPFLVGCSILTFNVFEKPMRDLISRRRKFSGAT